MLKCALTYVLIDIRKPCTIYICFDFWSLKFLPTGTILFYTPFIFHYYVIELRGVLINGFENDFRHMVSPRVSSNSKMPSHWLIIARIPLQECATSQLTTWKVLLSWTIISLICSKTLNRTSILVLMEQISAGKRLCIRCLDIFLVCVLHLLLSWVQNVLSGIVPGLLKRWNGVRTIVALFMLL